MPEDYLPGLKGILETALKQSPQMLTQNISLAQAEAGRISGESILWPSLSGSASYAFNGAKINSGGSSTSTSSGGFYGINVGQPIYQWGAYKAQADSAKLAEQVAKHQYAEAYRTLAGTLRSQYLGLIVQKISVRNARYQLELAENDLAIQEENFKAGTVSAADMNQPRIGLQEMRLSVDRTTENFAHARHAYARMAGLDDLTEESIPLEIPHPADSSGKSKDLLGAFVHEGPENSLQGQIWDLYLKQGDLSYKIARTQLYPKFSFGASYGLSYSQSAFAGTVSQSAVVSYSYGVSANWTLFNGFASRAAKLSALATKRSYERQRKTYLDDTSANAQDLQTQVGFAARALELAEQHQALADDLIKRATAELGEGTIAPATVKAYRSNAYAVDYATSSARAEFLNRWSELVSLVGADPILNALPVSYLNLSHGK